MSVALPEIRTSTTAELDAAITTLLRQRDAWSRTSAKERLSLLDALSRSLPPVVERWVAWSQQAKGIRPGSPQASEDWAFVAILFRQIRALKAALTETVHRGRPQIPGRLVTRPDGRVVAQTFPRFGTDRVIYNGLSGEIWFNPGVSESEVLAGMARPYHTPPPGRITLVLGAGNVSALVPGDFLYKLFAESQVVLLKMNPVNAYLGPLVLEGYAPLVERGLLQVVYGGAAEGAYLAEHPHIDELHMTGSDATHDAILFGTGEEAAARKRERRPRLTKRFTSELGNISPVIVVPGAWTRDEVIRQGRNIAARLTANAGFNCLTPRLVIQQREWVYRDLLNDTIHQTLAELPTAQAYYPNASRRHAAFVAAHPEARQHGTPAEGDLPWTYIPDVDPTNPGDIVFRSEPFCSLFAETALSADSVPQFIAQAVTFANETLWGTLVATLIVHPSSQQDPAINTAIEQAVADLRYGTVGVNVFGELGYATVIQPWGGHSGQDIFDVQSGIGFVNNALLFDDAQIQKGVLRQPFGAQTNSLDPRDSHLASVLPKLAWFESDPSLRRLFDVIWSVVRA